MIVEFLRKDLFTEEELKKGADKLVYYFNKVAASKPDIIDQLTYMDFYKGSGEQIPVDEWLNFMSDYRVSNLLNKIMLINARANVNRLMTSDEKSVAASQKLTASLAFLGKYFDSLVTNDAVVYVYTSIPLTDSEKKAANAKSLLVKPKQNPYNPMKASNE